MLALLFAFALAPAPSTPPVCPAPASAPNDLVNVHGQVTDVIGAPAHYVLVRLKPADAPANYTKTDERGCFQILTNPGDYTLTAFAPAFFLSSKKVLAQAGKEDSYNIVLRLASSGPVYVQDPAVPIPPLHLHTVCFIDQNGLPVDDVQFTLESSDTPKQVFTGSKPPNYADDHPGDWGSAAWGCWFVNGALSGIYTLNASAPHYQHLQKTLDIDSESVSFQLTPLPAQP